MKPRHDSNRATCRPPLASFVNKFASTLEFAGAGRHRSHAESSRAAWEADQDAQTAAALMAGGIDPFADEITVVDLATCGARVERRRPLRRWGAVFYVHQRREQRAAAGLLAAYQAEQHQAARVAQIRLRPLDRPHTLLTGLRAHHQREAAALARRLDYVARRHPGAVVPLCYSTHHRPVAVGVIDVHFHVAADVRDPAALAASVRYLSRKYDVHVSERDDAPASALAVYMRDGTARHARRMSTADLGPIDIQDSLGR